MSTTCLPLRWETTGNQWWYASPIDFAAANGYFKLVKELLYIDTNLLFKLTSLRRLRRLETVWDDESLFDDVAKCRSQVARKLLAECENKNVENTLIGAGYGGWLLYTAASAGDLDFVKQLLVRDSLLVYGEGEYGVTDILYAAAKSKNSEVFRLLLDYLGFLDNGGGEIRKEEEVSSVFRLEMMNRAVHAAARGGNVEVLKELLGDCTDVLVYKDSQGSTLLHTASARGQTEAVKYLVSSYDIINCKDKQGNTALHVAAYRGNLDMIEVLVSTFPSVATTTNNYGDTFLHMAVASFRVPGLRRLDRQVELMKQLVSRNIGNMKDIINVQNNEGKTALHMAIHENINSNLVELLMTIPAISFSVRDSSGRTPLDLIRQQQQRSSASEMLRTQLYSTGGISNCKDYAVRKILVSQLKMHCVGGSPGSSFRVSDKEIMFLKESKNAGTNDLYNTCSGEPSQISQPKLLESKRFGSINQAAKQLKILLRWPMTKYRKSDDKINMEIDDESFESYNANEAVKSTPISLRQRYKKHSSLPNNKRVTVPCLSDFPSASTKGKFTKSHTHGVIQLAPEIDVESPVSPSSSESSRFSHITFEEKGDENNGAAPSCSSSAVHTEKSQVGS